MNGNLSDISPIVVDIETAPLPNVREYLEPPDLTDIKAPSNYVKQEAIDGYIEREKVKRLADHETDCTNKAALDFNLARIVAIGWWTEQTGVVSGICPDEAHEAAQLEVFWKMARQRVISGFCVRQFDLPMMIQRSRYLGVNAPSIDLGRYARGTVVDIFDLLTFNDLRAESLMPRTVHAYCKRFDIPVADTVKGKDIPSLIAGGEWGQVRAHVESDVLLEVAIGKRIGAIYAADMVAA
jgi:hypothetical protein